MKNPEKYGWDPKWLLSHLIDIYLHLDSEALVSALANDQVRQTNNKSFLNDFSAEIFQAGDIPGHRSEDGEHPRQDHPGCGEVTQSLPPTPSDYHVPGLRAWETELTRLS